MKIKNGGTAQIGFHSRAHDRYIEFKAGEEQEVPDDLGEELVKMAGLLKVKPATKPKGVDHATD